MIGITNLGHMTLSGWEKRYSEILKEFGYSKAKDLESAKKLNHILKNKFPLKKLSDLINHKNIFVIGAGPTLLSSIPILKKHNSFTKIVADSAVKALLENKIRPDIVVSDLDGDEKSLKKIGKMNTINTWGISKKTSRREQLGLKRLSRLKISNEPSFYMS